MNRSETDGNGQEDESPVLQRLKERLVRAEAERDYYRAIAEQTGKKALGDADEFARVIRDLRQTEEALRAAQEALEETVAERTADLRNEIRERMETERALRESEERYRLLNETSPNSITVVDIAGKVLMSNRRSLEIYRHGDVSEVVGRSIFEWVPPENRERAAAALAAVLQEGSLENFQLQLLRSDGSPFWASTNASVVRDPRGNSQFVIIVTADITERKQREERMKRLNAGLLSLGHDYDRNVQILVALSGELLDADCALYNRLDGELLCVKGQWKAPEDLRREDSPQGHLCFDVIRHNIDQPLVVRNLEDTPYAKTDPNVAAYGLHTYIGYPVRFGGVARGSLCVVYERDYQPGADELDIIGFLASAVAQEEERGIATEALRRSEEFTRSILDNVSEAILLIDRDYRILTANRSYCAWAGAPLGDIVGRHCYAVSHGFARPCYEQGLDCAVRRAFETGGHHTVLYKSEDASGKSTFVEKRAFPVKDAAGAVISVIETIHNVSERHLLEEERLRTQKLEAIGTLAGGIAHDFNNLLQGVFGYMSMAKMNLDRRETAAAMLEQAEKALGMSVNLTTQLLTFAKGGRPVKKCIALLPVIENAAKFALSGSSFDCRIQIEEGLWCAEADEGQMGQVIQNIVLNASEAMPGGGTVKISAVNMDIPAGERPSMPEGGKFVRIVIEDKGVGIPGKYLTQIFDPYFSTKQKGSGLGLATSYSIIRNHGGVIDVASEPDRGTIFSIFVPACAPGEALSQPAESAVQRAGRILVMDDEEMVRLVAKEMLESLGHEVETVEDGDEAIASFLDARKSGKSFDAVILDLTVKGGMGGEMTLRKMQEIDPDVRAVVSTGYADNHIVAGFRSYGFAAFLNKPYRIDALKDCLSALLGRS